MNATFLEIPGLVLFEPKVFGDDRGFFYKNFNKQSFEDAVGYPVSFVQDNHLRSSRGMLRGLDTNFYPMRKARWYAWFRARFSMLPSILASRHRLSVNGTEFSCLRRTSTSCGFPKVLPIVL